MIERFHYGYVTPQNVRALSWFFEHGKKRRFVRIHLLFQFMVGKRLIARYDDLVDKRLTRAVLRLERLRPDPRPERRGQNQHCQQANASGRIEASVRAVVPSRKMPIYSHEVE
ncbi:MAG: hypothetical protein ACE5EO_01195 [Candidatus Krumholzibacteriia bacterium]